MRIRITLDIRTTPHRPHTPRANTTPPTTDTPPTLDAPPTHDTDPTTDTTPTEGQPTFGFSLDGTTLSSDTERAEPYDDSRDAEYEDDDEHEDTQQ